MVMNREWVNNLGRNLFPKKKNANLIDFSFGRHLLSIADSLGTKKQNSLLTCFFGEFGSVRRWWIEVVSRYRCYTLFNLMETDMKKATVNLTSLQNILWSSHCSTNQHCNLNPLMFNRKHTCKMVNCQNHFSRGYLWSQIGSLQIMLCLVQISTVTGFYSISCARSIPPKLPKLPWGFKKEMQNQESLENTSTQIAPNQSKTMSVFQHSTIDKTRGCTLEI